MTEDLWKELQGQYYPLQPGSIVPPQALADKKISDLPKIHHVIVHSDHGTIIAGRLVTKPRDRIDVSLKIINEDNAMVELKDFDSIKKLLVVAMDIMLERDAHEVRKEFASLADGNEGCEAGTAAKNA